MIVVTGANGFIGSAIIWELNQSGVFDVLAVDTVSREQRPGPLKKRKFHSFIHKDQIWETLSRPGFASQVNLVIHMGANSSTTETNWEHLYENNTLYTQRLFEWCTQNEVDYIYASSAATYGAGNEGYSDGTAPEKLTPLNLYGKSKNIFDQWACQQSKVPPHWYGLKFFNVYGPNEYHKDSMASLVCKAHKQIQDKGEISLFKSYRPQYRDGEQQRDFVYVKDVTRWILELSKRFPPSGIYNMGYGRAHTWLDLVKPIFVGMSVPEKIKFIEMPEEIRRQYQYFTEADMGKWLSAGLSAPQWSLEQGVLDYVYEYLSQKDPGL